MKIDIIDNLVKKKAFSNAGFFLLTVAIIAILLLNILTLISLF
ncbi:hypothetical protein BC962_0778 [Gillisia mitskevichiae]|uniref:Uncharacterized protein n=1 Tax=Gillisia mitskevichiae TaxID=270921 RepID=A0A495PYK4_9FLAO|nr:hypothetical protein BC962_0778 [Gillisia mitskevichiae]